MLAPAFDGPIILVMICDSADDHVEVEQRKCMGMHASLFSAYSERVTPKWQHFFFLAASPF